MPQLKSEHFFFLSALHCVTEEHSSCGPCPTEVVAILLLALILAGSGHENLFGRMWSLMLSAWTEKPDLMFLSIVTDLCICTEYVKHTKCFVSLPKSQDVAWNHLLFPSVHFYLCWLFSRTETLASRHRAASSVSSHFSSAVSPEWNLLICNDLNSTAGFLFSLPSHSKERLNHLDRDLELSRHPYSSGIQNPDIREQ